MTAFELLAKLKLDRKDYDSDLKNAEKDTQSFGDKLKKGIAGASAAVAGLMATAGTAAISLGKTVLSNYGDYQQMVGGVQKLYGNMGQSLEEYAKSVGKSVGEVQEEWQILEKSQNMVLENAKNAYATAGMSANQYMETATQFSAALINSLGGDTVKAAEQTDIAMRAISDNFNTFGGDIETIKSAFQGFAKQNYTMLDNLKLGYGGTKTEMERLIADANEYAASIGEASDLSIDSFSDIVTAIDLVQQKQNIAGTTALEATTTLAGSLGMLKASWENFTTALGDADANMEEVTKQMVDSAKTVMKNVTPIISNIAKALPSAIVTLVETVGELLPDLIDMVSSLMEQLIPAILGMLPELVTAIADFLPELLNTLLPVAIESILSAIPDIIRTLLDAIPVIIDALLSALPDIITALCNALPEIAIAIVEELPTLIIGIAKAIIDNFGPILEAVVEGLLTIIAKIWEWFSDLTTKLAEWYLEIVEDIAEFFKSIFEDISEWFSGIIKDIGQWFSDIWTSISDWFSGLFEDLAGWFSGIIEDIGSFFGDIFNNIGTWLSENIWQPISDFFSNAWELGKQLVTGIWEGIKGAASWLWEKITGWISDIWGGIKEFFGIASPSKQMAWIGDMLAQGLAGGIEDNADEAIKAATDMASEIQNAVDGISTDIGLEASAANIPITKTVSVTEAVNAKIDELKLDFNNMLDTLSRMGVYLDRDTLVGQITPDVNRELGRISLREARA